MSDLVIVAAIASFTINFVMAMSHYVAYKKDKAIKSDSDIRYMKSEFGPKLNLTDHVCNLDKAITDILQTNPDILDRLPHNNVFKIVLRMNERKS